MKYFWIVCLVFLSVKCTTETEEKSHKVYKSLSEKQIYENSNLKYEFGAVLVTRLEDLGSPTLDYEKDTGGRGIDAIPLTIPEKGTYTFTKDNDLKIIVKVFNKASNTFIDLLNSGQTSASINLETGEYILQFTSEINYIDTAEGFQNVFLYPVSGSSNIFNNRFSRYECTNANLSSIDLTN
nr:hypothetical protein [Melioribacteraceae bacterium]